MRKTFVKEEKGISSSVPKMFLGIFKFLYISTKILTMQLLADVLIINVNKENYTNCMLGKFEIELENWGLNTIKEETKYVIMNMEMQEINISVVSEEGISK